MPLERLLCAERWTPDRESRARMKRDRRGERGGEGVGGRVGSEGMGVPGGSCVRGSHNAERHLANKGRNNNSLLRSGTERLSLRTRRRAGTPQQSAVV